MVHANVLGICTTCNNIITCFHRKSHDQPVWYCEEFDNSDYTVESRVDYSDLQNDDLGESLRVKEKEANQFKGLCSNCENRESCAILKPEGVWYCEEYQ
jgi:hypothetical protein